MIDSVCLLAGIPRFLVFTLVRLVVWISALAYYNKRLPMFAVLREGAVNNNERRAVEPFLPDELFVWSTNTDNSLWGDSAHRERNPDYKSYTAMVAWLNRNAAQGWSWSVLGAPVEQSKIRRTWYGWRMGCYFQISVNRLGKFGWLLDAYADGKALTEPKAFFVFWR